MFLKFLQRHSANKNTFYSKHLLHTQCGRLRLGWITLRPDMGTVTDTASRKPQSTISPVGLVYPYASTYV